MMTKHLLRQKVNERKSFYGLGELEKLSIPPLFGLESQEKFVSAQHVALYWSLPDEVATHQFIEKWYTSKNIYLPVVSEGEMSFVLYQGKDKMSNGAFNIETPDNHDVVDPMLLDLIVVPGVAFDLKGHRLGRGRGFYDRFLVHTNGIKIGIAFPFQMFHTIPIDAHDVTLDKVII